MEDILAKKNRHLFLEEKDNTHNSFISNINYAVENIDTIKTFNDNINNGELREFIEAYLEQIGTEGNAWVVRLTEIAESILATKSGFNYETTITVLSDIDADATITLPTPMTYRVGTHMLFVSWNGVICYKNHQYAEVGAFYSNSKIVKIKQPIKAGDVLQFRTVALASYEEANNLPIQLNEESDVSSLKAVLVGILNDIESLTQRVSELEGD